MRPAVFNPAAKCEYLLQLRTRVLDLRVNCRQKEKLHAEHGARGNKRVAEIPFFLATGGVTTGCARLRTPTIAEHENRTIASPNIIVDQCLRTTNAGKRVFPTNRFK